MLFALAYTNSLESEEVAHDESRGNESKPEEVKAKYWGLITSK